MWDCHWQNVADYGTRYDVGLYEAHPLMMAALHKHRRKTPSTGYVASLLGATAKSELLEPTQIVSQTRWNDEARAIGGLGASGKLQFQRGTVAACWAIEWVRPGDEVLLFGFDNTVARKALPVNDGYSKTYIAQPSTGTFNGYVENAQRYGNHDFGIERTILERIAKRCGVKLTFAQEKWPRLKALVLGDAKCVRQDAARALNMFEPDAVCATNNIGRDWEGRLDYWCTLHPESTRDWSGGIQKALADRLEAGRNRPQIWGHKNASGIDRVTQDDPKTSPWLKGSTGLLCVRALRLEGFERIVLSGVPMSKDGGHYYDSKDWLQFDHYTAAWKTLRDELAPYVRSMSGYTRQLFGEPTAGWLAG